MQSGSSRPSGSKIRVTIEGPGGVLLELLLVALCCIALAWSELPYRMFKGQPPVTPSIFHIACGTPT